MAKLGDLIGTTEEDMNKVEEQQLSSSGEMYDNGIYDAKVDEAYIRTTDKGAQMFHVGFKLNIGEELKGFTWETNIVSGDEKGNKPYWVVTEAHSEWTRNTYGVGTKVDLPGRNEMKVVLNILGESNPNAIENAEVKYRDNKIKVVALPDLQGKTLKLAIHTTQYFYEGKLGEKNYVYAFMNMDGNSEAGKPLEEKCTKHFNKTPIQGLKGKEKKAYEQFSANTASVNPAQAQAAENSGW